MNTSETSLDPNDWPALRSQCHEMLDDLFDFVENIRQFPVWQPAPKSTTQVFLESLPTEPRDLSEVHHDFLNHILPYAVGNTHPGFMGWVHGGGTPVGMMAELLAAGLNANLGGRDQIPIAVERQITRWMSELFAYPDDASGLFVTGSSMANFIGMLVAKTAKIGTDVRESGMQSLTQRMTAYTSTAAHGCIARAMEMGGFGSAQLRRVAVNNRHQIRLDVLEDQIKADLQDGHLPFCIVGTAGTVDTGAIDDLASIAGLAKRYGLWFHVDGACGALGILSPKIRPFLNGITQSDSIALDFHKWAQVPYDAGFILVRDSKLHHDTFASPAAYLSRDSRGMSAGSPWPCDFGPDLSRSFKALKVWFTLQVYGAKRIGDMMEHTCNLAQYMAKQIARNAELELMAPVALNIVCFRYRCNDSDRMNNQILVAIQESGVSAPSSTTIHGHFAIRAAIFNHRTTQHEINALLQETVQQGRKLASAHAA